MDLKKTPSEKALCREGLCNLNAARTFRARNVRGQKGVGVSRGLRSGARPCEILSSESEEKIHKVYCFCKKTGCFPVEESRATERAQVVR